MGKGTIISGGTDGQYQLQINYDRVAYDAELSKLTEQITEWAIKISDKESEITNLFNERTYLINNQFHAEKIAEKTNEITRAEQEKAKLEIYKLSFEKRKEYLEDNMPNDETMSAWCADLTEDLTGEVGTVEIPGESTHIQIQPGYESNADYDQARDGQLLPTVVATPAQTFYNLAMLPGWQKWKPLFRYGTITAIDGDTATVTLENIKSSQQALEINQDSTLSDVDIEYMDCNGSAFEDGDEVLLKFTGQNWDNPVVVGFREEPKPCDHLVIIYMTISGSESKGMFINAETQTFEPLTNPINGELLFQPFDTTEITGASIIFENGLNYVAGSKHYRETSTDQDVSTNTGTHTGRNTNYEVWTNYGHEWTITESWAHFDSKIRHQGFTAKDGFSMFTFPPWYEELWWEIEAGSNKYKFLHFYDQGIDNLKLVTDYINATPLKYRADVSSLTFAHRVNGVTVPHDDDIITEEAALYSVDGTYAEVQVGLYEYTNTEVVLRDYVMYYPSINMGLFDENNQATIEPTNHSTPKIYTRKQSLTYSFHDYTEVPVPTAALKTLSEAQLYSLFGVTKTNETNIRFLGVLI